MKNYKKAHTVGSNKMFTIIFFLLSKNLFCFVNRLAYEKILSCKDFFSCFLQNNDVLKKSSLSLVLIIPF